MSHTVSVLLPVLNDASSIAEALDSILQQNSPLELIVIDGGSTDGTLDVLYEYESNRDCIRVLHQNSGPLASALNQGLEAASGKYIARQDADDRSLSGRFQTQREYLEQNPSVHVVGTGSRILKEDGTQTIYQPSGGVISCLNRRNPIIHGSIMAHRETLKDVGGYDPRFIEAEDYDLWVRLAEEGYSIVNLEHILYEHRSGEEHLSVDSRRLRTLYGVLASCSSDTKSKIFESDDGQILSKEQIYARLDSKSIGKYERRMARSYLQRQRVADARSAAKHAVSVDPVSFKNLATLLLAQLPVSVSSKIINEISTF